MCKKNSGDSVCVVFDLDGTLLDTSPGIFESVRYATNALGYRELSQDELLSFIGPPLVDSFMRCYGCSEEEARRLTAAYRVHYPKGALLNARPYDGVFELCDELRKAGACLAVATSKPQVYSERILSHFGFEFPIIHGADLKGVLTKTDLIRLCAQDSGASATVMVGDTEYDAEGARQAGVPFVAVTYGFGNREKMLACPHIGVAEAPLDVLHIIRDGWPSSTRPYPL